MPHLSLQPPPTEANAAVRGRILPFDGLRALAFLSVFINHATHLPLLWAGVDVFFVLSGFLITGILLERKRAGRTYFSYFYRRRVFRILPPYLLTIILFGLLRGWGYFRPFWLFVLAPNLQSLTRPVGAQASVQAPPSAPRPPPPCPWPRPRSRARRGRRWAVR